MSNMKIVSIEASMIHLPLKQPFTISYASYDSMPSVIVKMTCDNGVIGYGEGVADQHVTGETMEGVYQVITKTLAPHLIGKDPRAIESIHELMDKLILNATTAKAAIDIACFDAVGKALDVPVYQLIGGRYHDKFPITHVLSIQTPEAMAEEAAKKVAEGYDSFKLKVGYKMEEDVARIKAVYNRVGHAAKLRVDVNQGWENAATTLQALYLLKDVQLDWLEQPTLANHIDALQAVKQKSHVAIMADESLVYQKELKELIDKKACDKINIKLMKCGGIYPAAKLAIMAEMAGIDCQIGSMVESSIGSAAGFHVGFSKKNITSVELTGPLKFTEDVGNLNYDVPFICLNEKPGLGIEIDEAKLQALTIESDVVANEA